MLYEGITHALAVPMQSPPEHTPQSEKSQATPRGLAGVGVPEHTPACWGWIEQLSESLKRSVAHGQPEAHSGSETSVI